MDSVISFLQPILGYLVQHFGVLGAFLGYIVAAAPAVSVLIEGAEFFVRLSASNKDDQAVADIKAAWGKVLPYLEILPHVNVPIAAWLSKLVIYVRKGSQAANAAIDAWNKA